MRQLLNEEQIKMQRLAGVKPTNETFESVLREFIEVIEEHEYSLNEDVLNESLWEKAKYYLSKLGRYKANGKIFGKKKIDAEAEEKIKKILEKEGNQKIQVILDKIKDYAPDFPNNEESLKFLKICLEIAKTYDGIVAATKKSPDDKEFMPIDAANALITDLREIVKDFLDRKITAAYSVFNEAEGDEIGDTDDYDKNAAKAKLARRAGESEFESERMKTLKSNKLPLTLLSLGAAAGGLGWIYKMLSEEGTTVYEWVKDIQNLGDVQDGEGFTQILNRTMGADLSPDSPASEVADKIKEIGDGDFNKGVEMLTKEDGIFRDPKEAKEALSLLGNSDSFNEKTSLKDLFKGNLAGTGKSPFDMLVTKPGGVLAKMVMKQAIKKGATTAAMAPFAKVLGILGVAGAAAVKIARYKGQKSSRAKVLNDLYQSLKNIKPTEENPTVVPIPNTPGGEDKSQSTDQAEAPAKENPKGQDLAQKAIKSKNRDQEIVALLKIANPNLEFNDETKPLIQNIRRSPDTLIKKMSSVLGLDLGTRQKSTGAFKRSGVAENLMFENLMLEAAIDNALAKLGITDDAIRANKDAIVILVKDMYKLGGGAQVGDSKEKTPADVQTITKDIESNTSLKTALSRINTADEFEALVLGMAAMVNPNFAKQKQDIKAALFGLSNKIKAMKEESETPTDTQGVYKVIEALTSLKTHLNNINSKEEFEKLIFALLPFIDPNGQLTKDKNKLANAIIAASNRNALKSSEPVDIDNLGR